MDVGCLMPRLSRDVEPSILRLAKYTVARTESLWRVYEFGDIDLACQLESDAGDLLRYLSHSSRQPHPLDQSENWKLEFIVVCSAMLLGLWPGYERNRYRLRFYGDLRTS